jgi:hypothetical protein
LTYKASAVSIQRAVGKFLLILLTFSIIITTGLMTTPGHAFKLRQVGAAAVEHAVQTPHINIVFQYQHPVTKINCVGSGYFFSLVK